MCVCVCNLYYIQHCWTTATEVICLTIPAKNTTASFLKSRRQAATKKKKTVTKNLN